MFDNLRSAALSLVGLSLAGCGATPDTEPVETRLNPPAAGAGDHPNLPSESSRAGAAPGGASDIPETLAQLQSPRISLQQALDEHGHPLAGSAAITWGDWTDYSKQIFDSAGFVEEAGQGGVLADPRDFRSELSQQLHLVSATGLSDSWVFVEGTDCGELATQDIAARDAFFTDMVQWFKGAHGEHKLTTSEIREIGAEYVDEHAADYLPPALKDRHVAVLGSAIISALRGHIQIAESPAQSQFPVESAFEGIRLPDRSRATE